MNTIIYQYASYTHMVKIIILTTFNTIIPTKLNPFEEFLYYEKNLKPFKEFFFCFNDNIIVKKGGTKFYFFLLSC